MKAISIRELHAKTGHWLRQVAQHGEIRVTDHGRTVAKILPDKDIEGVPYFARRTMTPAFKKLQTSGKLRGGTDVTRIISEDREDRYS